jgi:hypothetical protein
MSEFPLFSYQELIKRGAEQNINRAPEKSAEISRTDGEALKLILFLQQKRSRLPDILYKKLRRRVLFRLVN